MSKLKKITWTTEKRKIKDLVPFEFNPRKISSEQREHLEKSLQKFDLAEIPVINSDNKIIAGHQRIAILVNLGRGEDTIDVRVPSRELTQEEFREYNIRSNANTGEWDIEVLREYFNPDDLNIWGLDLPELDFSLDDLKLPEIEVERQDSEEDISSLNYLRWGLVKIQLSPEEEQKLNALYAEYTADTKMKMGFVTFLLEPHQ